MSQGLTLSTIPLSVIGEFLQLTKAPNGEEFGLVNFCDLDWTQVDLSWLNERGDMERLPRFLELAEQINQALQSIGQDAVITDPCSHGAQNQGLDAVSAFLLLHEHRLIVDDTPGEAATALEVFDFVFHVLNKVGDLSEPSYVLEQAILLNRWDICKALGMGEQ